MKKIIFALLPIGLLFCLSLYLSGCTRETPVNPVKDLSGARGGVVTNAIDPTPTDNRGRIQIQGNDMTQGEISWAWIEPNGSPPTKAYAIARLDELYNSLTTRQKQDRVEALQKAKNFISGGPYTVVGPAIMRSYQNNNPRDPSIRIDVEIRKGTAFTN